ncbi:hypothetical protein [Angustibacter aerolatus]
MRTRALVTAAAVLVLGLGAPQTAAAAPPGNDTAATATVVDLLDLPYSTTAAVGDATTDADEAAIHTACGEPTTTGGVWYRVTPGYDTALTISTFADGGPGTRSVLATGTPGSLTAVDCTFISAELTRGTTYFVLVFGVAPGEAPTEIATTISSDACYGQKLDDFDGDLCPDLAVATTRGVDVRYGNGPTRLEKRREALALPGVAALATGWLDDDRYADLVVGLPSTTVDGRARAGEVRVYFGSRTGLGGGRATAVLHQGTLPGTGGAETGDLFGAALAVGQDGDVAIGAPGETVGDVVGAGGVVRVSFRTTVRGSFASQAGPVPGTPETGDAFGSAVAWGVGQLVVGVPGEDVGSRRDAGAVDVLPTSGTPYLLTQNTSGVPGTAETGDLFGAALQPLDLDDGQRMAVGVPGETIGRAKQTGMVNLLRRPAGARRFSGDALQITQGGARVVGDDESGDRLGQVLASSRQLEQRVLLIGVPFEDVGAAVNAGSLLRVVLGADLADGVVRSDAVNQSTPGWAGAPEDGDHLGTSIATLSGDERDDEDVHESEWYGVPGEDVGDLRQRGQVQGGPRGATTLVPGPSAGGLQFGRVQS